MAERLRKECRECRHWHGGYHLQGMRVPSFCNRHNHSQRGDDLACREFADREDTEQ